MWSLIGEYMWIVGAAVAVIFVSVGIIGKSPVGRILCIVVPLGLAVWDIYLVSNTGKGLKEHAICAAIPSSVDCDVSRKSPIPVLGQSESKECPNEPCLLWQDAGFLRQPGIVKLSGGRRELIKYISSRPKIAPSPDRRSIATASSKNITVYTTNPDNETVLDFHQPFGTIDFYSISWTDNRTVVFRTKSSLQAFNINYRTVVYQRSIARSIPASTTMDRIEVADISDSLFVRLCDDAAICEIGKVR